MKVEELKAAGTTAEDSGKETVPYEGPERVALVDGQVRLLGADDDIQGYGQEDEAMAYEPEGKVGTDKKADPDEGEMGTPEKEQVQYTLDELRTTAFDNIDPKRLPPEMQAWYKSMQTPIVRKNQELSESIKAVRELAEQLKRSTSEERPPEIDAREFYASKDLFLRGQVAGLFGVNINALPKNTNEWPDAMRLAYRDADDRLTAEARVRYESQRQREARRTGAYAILGELRAADREAYAFIEAKVEDGDITLKDEKAITEALLGGDRETVRRYYEQYKTEYLAKKHGIRTGAQSSTRVAPVKVEPTGAGGRGEGKRPPDFAELGRIKGFDDKLAWLRKHNIKP